jgi:hypothetical protein
MADATVVSLDRDAARVGILSGVALAEPLAAVAREGAFTSRARYAAEWLCGCWECSMTSNLPLTLMTVSTGALALRDCSKASEEGALGVCRACATEVSDISVRTAVSCVGADVFLVGAAKGREGAWRLSSRSVELLAISIEVCSRAVVEREDSACCSAFRTAIMRRSSNAGSVRGATGLCVLMCSESLGCESEALGSCDSDWAVDFATCWGEDTCGLLSGEVWAIFVVG